MDIINAFNIPEEGRIKQKVFIKDIFEQINASTQDKKIFSNEVKSIYLIGIVDVDTIRIPSFIDYDYKYESIYIFEVNLKSILHLTKINENLHSVFPNPIILIYRYNDTNILSTALKRINKIDNEKSVIEDIYVSDIFIYDEEHKLFYEMLNLQKIDASHLKQLYETITDIIFSERLINIIGFYPVKIQSAMNMRSIIKQIEIILSSIKVNEDRYKKETMMKDKIDIHIGIQKEKKQINNIVNKLKEDLKNG